MIELPPPDLFEGVILGGSGRYMGHDDGYTATTVRRLLEEAHEARRVAQAECERLKEERARIGIEHRRLIAEAVEKERYINMTACREQAARWPGSLEKTYAAHECAAAIRARSKEAGNA